LELKWWI
jgi:glycogen synthase kinase 3 beta